MSAPLLSTKFHLPPTRNHLVPRPRLVERLKTGLQGPLTLVSAPAGYGKTTLVSEWRSSIGRDWPVAWLSLEAEDNDLALFLKYLVAATEVAAPGLVRNSAFLLERQQPPSAQAVLTSLVYELAGVSHDLALFLDDYHVITSLAVHEALNFLLAHLPPVVHLVILTRADPPLPLSRLRARNQLVEIRAGHLRFTPGEAAAFLKDMMGLDLSTDDVETLEMRTEGWIAGLQLFALSLQGREQPHGFVSAFRGSHRYVADYLMDEVLSRQPEPVRSFLLDTSILDRLSGPLCDWVTGHTGGQAMLEQFERDNLFVTALDDERRWYRYHRLFADLLVSRLQADAPERVAALHRRACDWFEANGQIQDAVDHAFAGKHFELAAQIVRKVGRPMLAEGGWGLLLGWLQALPAAAMEAYPDLTLYYAWGLVLTGQLEEVERRLNDLERLLAKGGEGMSGKSLPGSNTNLRGQVAAIRSRACYLRGDFQSAIRYSQQALELLQEEDLTTRGILYVNLGLSKISAGDLDGACQALEAARRISQGAGNWVSALEASGTLAQVQEFQGQLRSAAQTYQEILQSAGDRLDPNVVAAHLNLGNVLYEWYDLDQAESHLRTALSTAQEIHMPDGTLLALLWLARVRLAQGDQDGSSALLRQAEQQKGRFPESILDRYTAGIMAYLALQRGDQVDAQRRVSRFTPFPEHDLSENFILRKIEYLAQVRLLIARGNWAQAEQFLEQLQIAAESGSFTGAWIEILALRALVRQGQADLSGAVDLLGQALQRAEPEGYTAAFVDLGAPMLQLLRQAQSRGISPEPVDRLLSKMAGAYRASSPHLQPLIEPLSERELEVLRLVAAGKSNRQIAEELVLATGTVKKHLSNIFGKLNAGSRTECVARARELHLFS